MRCNIHLSFCLLGLGNLGDSETSDSETAHAHGAHTWRTLAHARAHAGVHVGRAARYDTRITYHGCSTVGHITTAHTPWLCSCSVVLYWTIGPTGEREEGGGRHTVAPLVDLHGQVRGRARPGNLGARRVRRLVDGRSNVALRHHSGRCRIPHCGHQQVAC